jgi:tRNA pseudouridine55 synthase
MIGFCLPHWFFYFLSAFSAFSAVKSRICIGFHDRSLEFLMDGVLVVDKPGGMTSRDAVDQAASWFPRDARIGHTGTLDPLATGVLVLCLGQATRLAEYVQGMAKTYRSTFRLGAGSDTDDVDGTVVEASDPVSPSADELATALAGFVGQQEQLPPSYSAAHVRGRRAYALARRGLQVELAPRSIRIYSIQLLSWNWPFLDVEVRCGKGTYIRSLARDLGTRLGCGGLVQTLRRTQVGPFDVASALPLNSPADAVAQAVLPSTWAVHGLPRAALLAMAVTALRQGRTVAVDAAYEPGEEVAAVDETGQLVAVTRFDQGRLRPEKVLAGAWCGV